MLYLLMVLAGLWLFMEIGVRLYVGGSLKTDFYSSISREQVVSLQAKQGVKVASGPGWIHLGWIADPERESYRIEMQVLDGWLEIGQSKFGSFLIQNVKEGVFRVIALPKGNRETTVLGKVTAAVLDTLSPVFVPNVSSEWKPLFKPEKCGTYINDHTVYQDASGEWRLAGITDRSNGNYRQERYFAVGVSREFPPKQVMNEVDPIADFGDLAWAPHVLRHGDRYHLFWSPHKLHQMTSLDGINWNEHRITLSAPYHKFFRDPMVLQVAENQWLLYTTARRRYFSQIDIYQSFNLVEWQFIRSALRSSWGSERNSPFSSMESPFVTKYQNHYYLSLTYNNDSFFWSGLLMLFHIWINPSSYNDTRVFHSSNPYDFGTYRGVGHSPNLLTRLETHAPEIIQNPHTQDWFITTAGWPWVATLTQGEVAIASLQWTPYPDESE